MDNEFLLFTYEGKSEIEKEVFISDFKVFLRRFAKAYMNPSSFDKDDEFRSGGMYYGNEANLIWERLMEEKKIQCDAQRKYFPCKPCKHRKSMI